MGCVSSSAKASDMEEKENEEKKNNDFKRLVTMAASLEILDDPSMKRQDLRNRGLTLDALKDAFNQYKQAKDNLSNVLVGWNPGERLAAMVRTTTQTYKLSWAEMVENISNGKEKSGPCDVYVIHAWNTEFSDLISSIDLFERRTFHSTSSPRSPRENIRYFVDYFSINQNFKVTQPLKDIQDVIRSCECVLVVMSPWSAPLPLTRAWCLFELMTAIEAKLRVQVTMPAEENDKFMQQKLEEKQKVLAEIDCRRSIASVDSDENMIKKYIADKMGGFEHMDEKLKWCLNRWVLDSRLKVGDTMLEQIEARTAALSKTKSPANREYLAAKHSLGNALQLAGNYDKALEVHTDVLQMRNRVYSSGHPDVRASQSAVRLATMKKKKADSARVPI